MTVSRVLGSTLRRLWGEPRAAGLDVDAASAITVHREILRGKPLLRSCHERWYEECAAALRGTEGLPGDVVEIGSGAGFLEVAIPGVVKTDCVPNPFASRVVDAMAMDFPDASLRGLVLVGVLHHIPSPARFLREAERVLVPGGRLVLIEPNNSPLQRLLAKYLDHYEHWNDRVTEWENGPSGRMVGANLALPWVIVVRDRARFEREFPRLAVRAIRHHTCLSYVISGGMSYRSFLPGAAVPLVNLAERALRPWMRSLGTLMTVEIERTR